jgi:hypothetical protein
LAIAIATSIGDIVQPRRGVADVPVNSNNGSANDWHLMHLGNMSLGCAGLVMTEMTDVNPQGRISPKCAGLWSDENEAALKRVHDFCRQYGVAKLGVQLAHAGRKGPTTPPAAGGKAILEGPDAWTPEAPSAIPVHRGDESGSPKPQSEHTAIQLRRSAYSACGFAPGLSFATSGVYQKRAPSASIFRFCSLVPHLHSLRLVPQFERDALGSEAAVIFLRLGLRGRRTRP